MSDYFIFDDIDSRDFGVHIFDSSTDNAPAKVYDRYEVPGRNGDVLVDQRRFENVQHVYWGVIYEDYEENLRDFRAVLMREAGYRHLEDSIHPDEFYDACFIEALEVQTAQGRGMGKFQLVFDRKPQRWLKSGEEIITLTKSGIITNPTIFDAHPVLTVTGSGSIEFNGYEIDIGANNSMVNIDCATLEAYWKVASRNSVVSFLSSERPELHPGQNNIQFSDTITRVVVMPRWFTI